MRPGRVESRKGVAMEQYDSLITEIARNSVPFSKASDFCPLIEKVKDKRVVMLGESSHGTHEFYEWRSQITAELIRHHGFSFIAVEGDWPPCQKVNDFVQHRTPKSAVEALSSFSRWPTWMWANQEMLGLMEWLREWNTGRGDPVGFHGLDVYSLYDSMEEVRAALARLDPKLGKEVEKLYACFHPYWNNEKAYTRSLFHYPEGCEGEVEKALEKILRRNLDRGDAFFDVAQNARIIRNAERYYHAMINGADSWNIRDRHMMETLQMLLDHYGAGSKCIIWEHNTHIGDYHATDMLIHGQVCLGGLAREILGEDKVALVGFTTFAGTVTASNAWDGPAETMTVPRAKPGSLEAAFHEAIPVVGHENFFVTLDHVDQHSPFMDYRGHRAIGVVYHPAFEKKSNYVPTKLARRYDAMVFIDETTALTPLDVAADPSKVPETYPFGSKL